VHTIRRMAKPQAEERTSLRVRRLAGVLVAGLGNGLGLVLWWQADQYVQPGASQLCLWPLAAAAIGPFLSYVTLMLVKSRYLVSVIRVLPMHLLNGMLFFLTVLLMSIGFYLGWTDGDSVSLLGAVLFLPYASLAPLVIGTYLIRDAPASAR
jgi:hypothetical protein